jgi:hypothetical protein
VATKKDDEKATDPGTAASVLRASGEEPRGDDVAAAGESKPTETADVAAAEDEDAKPKRSRSKKLTVRSTQFAEKARKFVADTREALDDLLDEAQAARSEVEPERDEYALMPSVNRVIGWEGDLRRALEGLDSHAQDLTVAVADVEAARSQVKAAEKAES